MELFENLPNPLLNIIRKQAISCDEVTENGKKCGEKFMYSVNEFLVPERKDELKKVMVNCTKFCLKHLSDLAINGELLLGYETKDEKNVISLIKDRIAIRNDQISLYFNLNSNKSLDNIDFLFNTNFVDDIKEFKNTMIKKEVGYPRKIDIDSDVDEGIVASVSFDNGIISKSWRKFIHYCFKNTYSINLGIEGHIKGKKIIDKLKESKIINMKLFLGNLNSINSVNTETLFGEHIVFFSGEAIIKNN